MANRTDNIYVELFEQLPIPKRLEPENIAAMLNERMALNSVPEPVMTSFDRNITKTSNKHKTSTAYRSIASLAACAALAFGVAGYAGVFDADIPAEVQQGGGAYASDYDDVHRTFAQYYIDDTDKKTLDSAIRDIDHSYNENENDPSNAVTHHPDENGPTVEPAPEQMTPSVEDKKPDNTVPAPSVEDPEPVTEPDPTEHIDDLIPLPKNKAEDVSDNYKFGAGYIAVSDENIIRIIRNENGKLSYSDNIFPTFTEGSDKSLLGFYADGTKLTAVYSVVRTATPYDSAVDGMLDGLYGRTATGSQYSVEVCVYDVAGGVPYLFNDVIQGGSLVDMNYSGGALYLVTAYSDYRVTPIIGVDDLESYVPSYTVNGVKFYVEAENIMIPDYLATTDYTVISGISAQNGAVSVQAVLGYEGRVILKNGAVYLFGYDTLGGTDVTSVKVFGLSGGNVSYAGYKDIGGIALGGAGISVFKNAIAGTKDAIAVTTVSQTPDGYDTILSVYDSTMELVSRLTFPGALTTAKREGTEIYLSGNGVKYGVDLTDPADPKHWEVKETAPKATDPAYGLIKLGDGYVTLTKSSSGLVLSKISKNERGELRLDYKTTIHSGDVRSKAIENNGLLFVSGNTVGVPYGYFDGLDYCFKYALYQATATGFELVSEIEVHETDAAFENGAAVLSGGYLYIFSDGRIYAATTQDGLDIVGTAEIIESAYSGHSR